MDLIALADVETSGTDPQKDRLLEVAVGLFSVRHASLVMARTWLLEATENPAEHINGIAGSLCDDFGVPREQLAIELPAFARGAELVLAHNANFDRQWLPELHPLRWACSVDDIEWPRHKANSKLVEVAVSHGVGVVAAHRALTDVMTMAALLERTAEMLKYGIGESDIYDRLDAFAPPDSSVSTFELWLDYCLRPKPLFENADKGYDPKRNELYKQAGFRWVPEKKSWQRRCGLDEVAKLPFEVRRVV